MGIKDNNDDDFRIDMSFLDDEEFENKEGKYETKELKFIDEDDEEYDDIESHFLKNEEDNSEEMDDDEIEYYDDDDEDYEEPKQKLTKNQLFNRIMIGMGGAIALFTIFFACVIYKEFFMDKAEQPAPVVVENETTSPEEIKEGQFVSPYSDKNISEEVKTLINSAKLEPLETGMQNTDMKISLILDSAVVDTKTTYENARNIYDYLVNSYELSTKTYLDEDTVYEACSSVDYTSYFDMEMIYRAGTLMSKKTGSSQDFAAALTVLYRAYGLDAYYIDGQMLRDDGNTESHGYTAVKLEDKYYIFDAAYEKEYAAEVTDNVLNYTTFCMDKNDKSDIYTEYGFDDSIEKFEKFATLGKFTFSAKFSAGGETVSANVNYSANNNTSVPDEYLYADKGDTVYITGSTAGSNISSWKLIVKEYDDDMNYIDDWTEYSSSDSSSTNSLSYTIESYGYTKLTYMVTDENGRTCTITATIQVDNPYQEVETTTYQEVETTTYKEVETTTEEPDTEEPETEEPDTEEPETTTPVPETTTQETESSTEKPSEQETTTPSQNESSAPQ